MKAILCPAMLLNTLFVSSSSSMPSLQPPPPISLQMDTSGRTGSAETPARPLTPCWEHLPAWLAASSSGYDKIHISSKQSGGVMVTENIICCTEASWGFSSQKSSSWGTSGNSRENMLCVSQLRGALQLPGSHRALPCQEAWKRWGLGLHNKEWP